MFVYNRGKVIVKLKTRFCFTVFSTLSVKIIILPKDPQNTLIVKKKPHSNKSKKNVKFFYLFIFPISSSLIVLPLLSSSPFHFTFISLTLILLFPFPRLVYLVVVCKQSSLICKERNCKQSSLVCKERKLFIFVSCKFMF